MLWTEKNGWVYTIGTSNGRPLAKKWLATHWQPITDPSGKDKKIDDAVARIVKLAHENLKLDAYETLEVSIKFFFGMFFIGSVKNGLSKEHAKKTLIDMVDERFSNGGWEEIIAAHKKSLS